MPRFENSLYQWREMQHASLAPLHLMAEAGKAFYRSPFLPFNYTQAGRQAAAASEVLERITRDYRKPSFGLAATTIDGKEIAVREEVLDSKPFGRLLHFARDTKQKSPRLLIVAPMSGHHATLLRGTVEALLPFADVTITDWIDAREVPVVAGKFDLNDYIEYLLSYMRLLGPDLHVMAVCQPAVPVFAAAALMNALRDPAAPRSMILIGGPIDTRKAPTKVNLAAKEHALEWFESNVITRVPINHPGFMRRVYPGFIQLMSFISLNLERHIESHVQFFNHLVQGDGEGAAAHKKFYDEYLSVADLTAEFYLQSLDVVFQRHLLPLGKMEHDGALIDPGALRTTALLCLEGQLDDISGLGQTRAALDLAKHLPSAKKQYHMEPKVGHYGIFNGRKYRSNVVPVIMEFIGRQGGK